MSVENLRGLRSQALPEGSVRIDRRTRWGNPFRMSAEHERAHVIAKHRAWLWRSVARGEIPLEDLAGLHGKCLWCWCAPAPCHGDTLAEAAAWAHAELERRARGLEPHPIQTCGACDGEGRVPGGTLPCERCHGLGLEPGLGEGRPA